MNDLLIANTHQYAPSKYHFAEELNKPTSRAAACCSPPGSDKAPGCATPWATRILNTSGRTNGNETAQHYFVYARDLSPEQRRHEWAWMDWTDEETTITSDMHRGYVVPDGWDEVHFNRGATITVNADAPN